LEKAENLLYTANHLIITLNHSADTADAIYESKIIPKVASIVITAEISWLSVREEMKIPIARNAAPTKNIAIISSIIIERLGSP
jgi:hypothetical protein